MDMKMDMTMTNTRTYVGKLTTRNGYGRTSGSKSYYMWCKIIVAVYGRDFIFIFLPFIYKYSSDFFQIAFFLVFLKAGKSQKIK